MQEQLDIVQAISLDRIELRKLAFEMGGGHVPRTSVSDLATLTQHLRNAGNRAVERSDIALLANLVAKELLFEFDPATDVETAGKQHLQVSETYWRKLVSNRRREPWAFICNYAMNKAASVHTDVHGVTYGFHENVTTWRGIVASGSGSVVVFYNTSHAPTNRRTYSGLARVRTIEELPNVQSGLRTWRAHLEDYRDIRPVPAGEVAIPGRNPQHGIQAISWSALGAILAHEPGAMGELSSGQDTDGGRSQASSTEEDLLWDVIARSSDLVIPVDGSFALNITPESEYVAIQRDVDEQSTQGRSAADQLKNKAAEIKAIEIATAYLHSQGWILKRDCQKLGLGYDLQFGRATEELHVEVKGIRGSRLAFNMTAKEWHTCKTDRQFLLLAITSVLDRNSFTINVLWPHQVVSLSRRATQYRFQTDHSTE